MKQIKKIASGFKIGIEMEMLSIHEGEHDFCSNSSILWCHIVTLESVLNPGESIRMLMVTTRGQIRVLNGPFVVTEVVVLIFRQTTASGVSKSEINLRQRNLFEGAVGFWYPTTLAGRSLGGSDSGKRRTCCHLRTMMGTSFRLSSLSSWINRGILK